MPRYITVKEAAEHLRVTPQTIRGYLVSYRLPYLGKGKWLISELTFERLKERLTVSNL